MSQSGLDKIPQRTEAQAREDRLARIRRTPVGLLTEEEISLLDPDGQKCARNFQERQAREANCPGHKAVDTSRPEQRRRGWHPAHCEHCGKDMSVDSGD